MAMGAARHARQIVAHGEQVVALELLAAAQALDLRMHADASVRLGQGTAKAQQIIRREVAFLERDRLIMDDARKMVELVKSGELVKAKKAV